MISKKAAVRSLVLLAAIGLSLITIHYGCVSLKSTESFSAMTAKEKLACMYQLYNQQHEKYLEQAKRTDLTDLDKQLLRKKKQYLESLQILLPVYDKQVQEGRPSQSYEKEICDLLAKLDCKCFGEITKL